MKIFYYKASCPLFILLFLNFHKVFSRIIGGYEVFPAFKYNFIASLQKKAFHACAGTLIRSNIVITAAHCVPEDGNIDEMTAVFHRHDIALSDETESGIRREVISFIKHDKYNENKGFNNDIALLKLDQLGCFAFDIIVDSGDQDFEGSAAFFIGWGNQKTGDVHLTTLLETSLSIPYLDNCVATIKQTRAKFDAKTQLCAGIPQEGHTICSGDSGGPLFVIDIKNQFVLIGIASSGFSCDQPNPPGKFTRVAAFKDMIDEAVESLSK